MFKLRRRSTTPVGATDLPLCVMCGQSTRIDLQTGRCALGHRVAPPVPVEDLDAATDDTAVLPVEATTELTALPETEQTLVTYDLPEPAATEPAAAAEPAAATEPAPGWAPEPASEDDGFGFLTWDEPAEGLSALDVDPAALPSAADTGDAVASPVTTELAGDLLDELDDVARARRKAVGTLGATVAMTAAFAGTVALLPF